MARRVRPTPLTFREMEERLQDVALLAVEVLRVPRVPRKARELVVEIIRLVTEANQGQ